MLGIGFIGTGGVAERHAEALREVRGTRLVGVSSRTNDSRESFANRHGARSYAEVDDLLKNPEVDAVFVLSRADTHSEYAMRALAAGKHVLLEKPVGTSPDEIRKLRDAAAKSDRVLMPSHNYIYSPEVRRMRHHLGAGKLGRLQSFWMLCNQRQTQDMGMPGMVLNDMMVHLVYSSLFFCGRPERIVAVGSNVYFESGADDQIGFTMTYSDGTVAQLWASWATEDMCREPWSCTVKVIGSEGSGVASWDNVKNNNQPSPGWDDSVYWDGFMYAQRYFVEECIGLGAKPLSTLDDALDAKLIVDAGAESLAKQSWVRLKF